MYTTISINLVIYVIVLNRALYINYIALALVPSWGECNRYLLAVGKHVAHISTRSVDLLGAVADVQAVEAPGAQWGIKMQRPGLIAAACAFCGDCSSNPIAIQ